MSHEHETPSTGEKVLNWFKIGGVVAAGLWVVRLAASEVGTLGIVSFVGASVVEQVLYKRPKSLKST